MTPPSLVTWWFADGIEGEDVAIRIDNYLLCVPKYDEKTGVTYTEVRISKKGLDMVIDDLISLRRAI